MPTASARSTAPSASVNPSKGTRPRRRRDGPRPRERATTRDRLRPRHGLTAGVDTDDGCVAPDELRYVGVDPCPAGEPNGEKSSASRQAPRRRPGEGTTDRVVTTSTPSPPVTSITASGTELTVRSMTTYAPDRAHSSRFASPATTAMTRAPSAAPSAERGEARATRSPDTSSHSPACSAPAARVRCRPSSNRSGTRRHLRRAWRRARGRRSRPRDRCFGEPAATVKEVRHRHQARAEGQLHARSDRVDRAAHLLARDERGRRGERVRTAAHDASGSPIPAHRTRSRSSPGPGTGSSTTTRRSTSVGGPCPWTCQACTPGDRSAASPARRRGSGGVLADRPRPRDERPVQGRWPTRRAGR